jgi:hypothetical protein
MLRFPVSSLTCPKAAVQGQFIPRRLSRNMLCLGRAALVVLSVLVMIPARAEGPVWPPRPVIPAANIIPAADTCLDQKERQAANQSGKVVPLATAMRSAKERMQGTVVRARLCHGKDGLLYVLTVLAHDGKVARLTIDAAKGTLVGSR